MNRRHTSPVIERRTPGVAGQQVERARLLREIKRLEWEFDRNPTLQVAGQLNLDRGRVSLLETSIAEASEESSVHSLLARVNAIAEHADRASSN